MSIIVRSHSPENLIIHLIPNRTVVRYPRRALPIPDEREQALGRVLDVVVEVGRVPAGVGDILEVGEEGGVEGEDVSVGLQSILVSQNRYLSKAKVDNSPARSVTSVSRLARCHTTTMGRRSRFLAGRD